jgi:16S rRNA (cytidine1402-2'-O)-methyltransferase
MGTLYIVSTPIGNLQDISLRALKTLFNVDVVACEDTRRTGLLLQKLVDEFAENPADKKKPMLLSYYEQIEAQRIPEIIEYLSGGHDVALISDAGTPLISDPGFKLVRECLVQKIKVESVPGASSVLTALTSSGLPTDKFTFVGYPPHKSGHRMTFYENIKKAQEILNTTVIMFEAPHKIKKTLDELLSSFGDIEIVITRELTKIHEEVRHEKISEAQKHFQKTTPRGEFVLLFHL